MAATLSIRQRTGAYVGTVASQGGTQTDTVITAPRLCTSDTPNPGLAYPVRIPTSGTNRSYEAWTFLYADSAPAGTINNVKWFTDGSIGYGTGLTLYAGTTSTYSQAAGTEGTTGNDSSVATTTASTYTTGSPLSVSGSLSNPFNAKISSFVVLQLDVTSSASAGTKSAETITWRCDET